MKKTINTENWFHGCLNEADLKKRYRELVKIHHPDMGGDSELFKSVNAQYEERLEGKYRQMYGDDTDKVNHFMNLEREAAEILAQVIHLQGVFFELVGRWIWASGETKDNRQVLKDSGFRWAPKKDGKPWYWRSSKDTCRRRYSREISLDEIKQKYGSVSIVTGGRREIA